MTTHRYPLEPLADRLHIPLHQVGGHQGQQHHGDTPLTGLALLAERLNIPHKTAQRHLQHGLSDLLADRLATRAGLHPAMVWPDWWDHAAGEDDHWYSDDPDLAHVGLKASA